MHLCRSAAVGSALLPPRNADDTASDILTLCYLVIKKGLTLTWADYPHGRHFRIDLGLVDYGAIFRRITIM